MYPFFVEKCQILSANVRIIPLPTTSFILQKNFQSYKAPTVTKQSRNFGEKTLVSFSAPLTFITLLVRLAHTRLSAKKTNTLTPHPLKASLLLFFLSLVLSPLRISLLFIPSEGSRVIAYMLFTRVHTFLSFPLWFILPRRQSYKFLGSPCFLFFSLVYFIFYVLA